MTKYSPSSIEKKWQEVWAKEKIYQPDLKKAARPFYNLMMFPYPSAEGLHVGNMYAFTGSDVFGRYKRMKGFDVFEPMGLDGFGIHSENYAIKKGEHPVRMAKKTEAHFYEQLHMIGNSFAWDNKLETYDPFYYKWTQWIFVKLFKASLAYRKKSSVNYCSSCKTVLADEQVLKSETAKVCERCSSEVEKRDLEQWFFRITAYADRLLSNIEKLDWSEKVKVAQRNWIGKKQGALINFSIVNCQLSIKTVEVFTTRPDTIFGTTFVVLSPDHPLSLEIGKENHEVSSYINIVKESPLGRVLKGESSQKGEKTGVFSGYYVRNPVNRRLLPIWISDYVLLEYGTGAVMGVPGHDLRDFEFAKKHLLPVLRVVKGLKGEKEEIVDGADVWEGEGSLINSNFLDNLGTIEAQKAVIEFLQNADLGKFASTYHLRDWIISRQRYWGPPIPMIYCEKCAAGGKSWFDTEEAQKAKPSVNCQLSIINWGVAGWYPVPEDQLPVLLPDVENFRPSGEGASPLANIPSFYQTSCPNCDAPARRETDVSDTFLDSSWYFLRYPSVNVNPKSQILNSKQNQNSKSKDQNGLGFSASDLEFPWDREITRRWLPVNSYIGGAEHSVLHLLYSRFITMFFKDLGMLGFEEPFTKFRAHGLLIRDGGKMSKSKGNVINPDDYIAKFGADTLRTYLMFLGPFDQGGDFRDTGIAGIYRFLGRVWNIIIGTLEEKRFDLQRETEPDGRREKEGRTFKEPHGGADLLRKGLSRLIKKVGDDIENLRFNTAIAALMEFLNLWQKNKNSADREVLSSYIKLLAPFAPFMAEELWQRLVEKVTPEGSTFSAKPGGTTAKPEGKVDPSREEGFSSIHLEPWPSYKEEDLTFETVTFVVQVNGKVRGRLELHSDEAGNESIAVAKAKAIPAIVKYLSVGEPKNVIFVPGKLISFVV